MAALASGLKGPLRVLDPACGDGNLLSAINDALPREMRRRVTLVGIENDEASFAPLRACQKNWNANEHSFALFGPANAPRSAAWQHGGVIDIAEQDRVK